MKKYLLLLLFMTQSLFAFGFVWYSSEPIAWLYANNFLDVLILSIGSIISSFLYFFVINPIIVPLLFLYLIYEFIKLAIVIFRGEKMEKNPLFSFKAFGLVILKIIALTIFFIGVPTGILILSASPVKTGQVSTISQLYEKYKLNPPIPLDMSKTPQDYGLATGIWYALPDDITIGDYFSKVPLITKLQTSAYPANITNGVFKVYLPLVIAEPLSFVDGLLYGSYNQGQWKPGLLPSVFNDSDGGKVGPFSLLVYDPGLILKAIFENDNISADSAQTDIPATLYQLLLTKYNTLKAMNHEVQKMYNELGTIYYNLFNTAISSPGYFVTIEKNQLLPVNKIHINTKVYNTTNQQKIIDKYGKNVVTYINDSENSFLKKIFNINSQYVEANNVLNNSNLLLNDYSNEEIYSTKVSFATLYNKYKYSNIIDFKSFWIYLPNYLSISANLVSSNVYNLKSFVYHYLTIAELPNFSLSSETQTPFTSSNIKANLEIINNIKHITLLPPLNLDLNNNKFLIPNLVLISDLNEPEFSNLLNIKEGKSGENWYTKTLNNNLNPLWGFAGYELHSAYLTIAYDIGKLSNNGSIFKDSSYQPPLNKSISNEDFSNENIINNYINNIQLYNSLTWDKCIAEQTNGNSFISKYLTSLPTLKESSKLYCNPIAAAYLNAGYIYSLLRPGASLYTNLINNLTKIYKTSQQALYPNIPSTKLTEETQNFEKTLSTNIQPNLQKMTQYYQNIINIAQSNKFPYQNLLQNYTIDIIKKYIARITKPTNNEVQSQKTQNNFDSITAKLQNQNGNGFVGDIITNAFKYLLKFLGWLLKCILKFIFWIVKEIAILVFTLLYSLHTVGIIFILIIFPFKFLLNVLFKNEYDELWKAFRLYLGYRLIDFVYILDLYIMGITGPILLFVFQKSYGNIVNFFLELILLVFVFVLTAKLIKAVFDMLNVQDSVFGMAGMFEKIGGTMGNIAGSAAATGASIGMFTTLAGARGLLGPTLGKGIEKSGIGNFVNKHIVSPFKNLEKAPLPHKFIADTFHAHQHLMSGNFLQTGKTVLFGKQGLDNVARQKQNNANDLLQQSQNVANAKIQSGGIQQGSPIKGILNNLANNGKIEISNESARKIADAIKSGVGDLGSGSLTPDHIREPLKEALSQQGYKGSEIDNFANQIWSLLNNKGK